MEKFMPALTDKDTSSPLWKDIVKTLIGASPIVPSPPSKYVDGDTTLGKPEKDKGLAIGDGMLKALQVNWNEMRHKFVCPSSFITDNECSNFETAGDVYFRIKG
jgi:hypothetical protein